jgi:hypothetical protein
LPQLNLEPYNTMPFLNAKSKIIAIWQKIWLK